MRIYRSDRSLRHGRDDDCLDLGRIGQQLRNHLHQGVRVSLRVDGVWSHEALGARSANNTQEDQCNMNAAARLRFLVVADRNNLRALV